MRVTWVTVSTAAVVGLAVGAFATGEVGGVVLPLLFVLACPLMMMFVMASSSGGAGGPASPDADERRAPLDADRRTPSSR